MSEDAAVPARWSQEQPTTVGVLSAEDFQRAFMNILDDFAQDKDLMERSQKAMLNILDDYNDEKLAIAEVNAQLEEAKTGLESRVQERTAALRATNRELESFSYSVSHDLRAPLRAIVGYSNILVRDHGPSLNEEAQRMLGIVMSNAMEMGSLIDGVLELSRIGRKAMAVEPVDLASLFRQTFTRLLAADPESTAEVRVGELSACRGDHLMMTQLVGNLASNALKYSRRETAPVVEVGQIVEGDEVHYFIRDNGVGFNEAHVGKIFGVFERLHDRGEFEGTGVGMAIAERVVQNHGGRIWAHSQEGEGATFWFTIGEA